MHELTENLKIYFRATSGNHPDLLIKAWFEGKAEELREFIYGGKIGKPRVPTNREIDVLLGLEQELKCECNQGPRCPWCKRKRP